MKILIIGCGLIGVTAAYFLAQRGHEVDVIDRSEGPARETSFANGALLTPSMSGPWNEPGCERVLLASLLRSDSAMQLRLRALPSLLGWGISFLRNASVARFERNSRLNLDLARHSLGVLQVLREELALEYSQATRGSLRFFRDEAAFEQARRVADQLGEQGLVARALSREQTVELEPALGPIAGQITGAIHYLDDEIGDAFRFCVALADHARRRGVRFHFGVEATWLDSSAGGVRAVVTRNQAFVADRYVVAAGSYSTPLLRAVGVNLPVAPVKGYSITYEGAQGDCPLQTPLIDDHSHAVVVPLGNVLRVAGTAEFAGFDLRPNAVRTGKLVRLLRGVLPGMPFDESAVRPWCGLRPMCADGVPLIGPTAVGNLFVSTGHGHLGWTLAAGSADLLAQLMSGTQPALDAAPYSLRRFS